MIYKAKLIGKIEKDENIRSDYTYGDDVLVEICNEPLRDIFETFRSPLQYITYLIIFAALLCLLAERNGFIDYELISSRGTENFCSFLTTFGSLCYFANSFLILFTHKYENKLAVYISYSFGWIFALFLFYTCRTLFLGFDVMNFIIGLCIFPITSIILNLIMNIVLYFKRSPINHTEVVCFYTDECKKNTDGYTLTDILNFNDLELEKNHNYIQWIFPLTENSLHALHAPVIDKTDVEIISTECRDKIIASFERMLKFYGLKLSYENTYIIVEKGDNWQENSMRWLHLNNHNYLRLTRIMKSLCLMNMQNYAKSLYVTLMQINEEFPGCISEPTLNYWNNLNF